MNNILIRILFLLLIPILTLIIFILTLNAIMEWNIFLLHQKCLNNIDSMGISLVEDGNNAFAPLSTPKWKNYGQPNCINILSR